MTNLIGISGRMGSGKDTAANILLNYFEGSNWQTKRFAGKLKEIASMMTGIPVHKFEDQEFKKTYLGPEWDNMQVRVFLQKLGTEAMRDGVHTNSWINALFSDFTPKSKWILTDCRFQNEFDAIKARGGKVIYIERGSGNTGSHPSEIEMEQFKDKCDFHIVNNSDMAALEFNLGIFLKENNLFPTATV